MTNASPWDEITVPSADLNVRQAGEAAGATCYWARAPEGTCLFVVELTGDHASAFRKQAPVLNGISTELRNGRSGHQNLVLELEKQADRDLFYGLCRSLLGSLEHAQDADAALALAMAHLKRWKAFLSGRRQHLTREEVRGLYAEIAFLSELMTGHMSHTAAVDVWLGPDRSQQDFIYWDRAVEIKAISGRDRKLVRISSEDQLESVHDRLYLRTYALSDLPDSEAASSLNAKVSEIRSQLNDAEALEAMDAKLAQYGYTTLPEYDEPAFVVRSTRTFRVEAEFPRLIRSELPKGVEGVKYCIKLEDIAEFVRENGAVFGEDE